MKIVVKQLWLIVIAVSYALTSLANQPENLDAIKIIVDKDVITVAQFNQRMNQTRLTLQSQGKTFDEEQATKEIQEQLIVESLQLQIAERSGIVISSKQLTESMNDTARRNQLTLAELKLAIEKEGQSYDEFRDNMRRQMLIQNVQQGHIRSQVNVSDKEVDNYLATPDGEALTQESYDVSFITYPLASGSSAESVATAEQALIKLRQQISAGQQNFSDYVSGKALNGTNISGNNLGRRRASDLPSLFVERVISLNTGDISPPLRSGAGWHLVKMNRKTGGKQEEYQVHAKHILIKPSAVRSDTQAQTLAEELFARLAADEDFSLLAKEYSDDPGSALQGGDLGWSSPDRYVPAFIKALESLQTGQTSQPFKSSFGWHIVNKIEERDHDITQAEQRNKARQMLGQRQYNQALEGWLSTIKGEAFIDVKR